MYVCEISQLLKKRVNQCEYYVKIKKLATVFNIHY